jgi:hypothetical protein
MVDHEPEVAAEVSGIVGPTGSVRAWASGLSALPSMSCASARAPHGWSLPPGC